MARTLTRPALDRPTCRRVSARRRVRTMRTLRSEVESTTWYAVAPATRRHRARTEARARLTRRAPTRPRRAAGGA